MVGNRRELKKLQRTAENITALQPKMVELSDIALRNKTYEFRRRLVEGETEDDILPEAFAVVREAGRRVLGMEHFPVQLIGGIVLHSGRIAEMRTGEGKTLVATLPSYLNALSGKGVHVVTTNDYLADRDSAQMGKIHEFLGLSVGTVLSSMSYEKRRAAYRCDITYITNSELGFDYLRDNMAMSRSQLVQRGFNYCIIDEVDSVLIDDAGTPLIISGENARSTKLYGACDVLAKRMVRGEAPAELSKLDMIAGIEAEESGDYIVFEKDHRVILTERGIERAEKYFRISNIADLDNIEICHHMDLALRANALMERDRDYVVSDGEVFIIDDLTGRIMPGRRYSDGLHQAIEAKEHVHIQKENRTAARITYQDLFSKYNKLSGMTGTGRAQEKEFSEVYGLDIVEIPTNRPVLRIDHEDLFFRTKQEKREAVCDKVETSIKEKRPVLVGTASVADSEELSSMFSERGIHHSVLNAKYHEREAEIVAQAGKKGAITIATNMAGRGTDIKLDDDARLAGGLLVIGTERYDSRRIDDQLRGRSGRQGDPGESCFYLSIEDALLKRYNSGRIENVFSSECKGAENGIHSEILSRIVKNSQLNIESEHYSARKRLVEFDHVLSQHREIIYKQRLEVLKAYDLNPLVEKLFTLTVDDALSATETLPSEEHIYSAAHLFDGVISPVCVKDCEGCSSEDEFKELMCSELYTRYCAITEQFGESKVLQQRIREIFLSTVDRHWADHMEELEVLRDGIGLVSYAQKDPVKEYQKLSAQLFEQLNRNIRYDTVAALLRASDLD